MTEAEILLSLADQLDAANDKWGEAASLPDWPEGGCSQGCVSCFAKWLRIRAAGLSRNLADPVRFVARPGPTR